MDHTNTLNQQVLEELVAIGFAQVTDYFFVQDGAVQLKDVLPNGAAIATLETTGKGVKIKCYDKLKALELVGKHLGMFTGKEAPPAGENNLLQAILQATREEVGTHDIPELQQAAAAGYDLVESGESTAL